MGHRGDLVRDILNRVEPSSRNWPRQVRALSIRGTGGTKSQTENHALLRASPRSGISSHPITSPYSVVSGRERVESAAPHWWQWHRRGHWPIALHAH